MASFVIRRAKDGQFFFQLKAGNGETILVSEMYRAKDSCRNGIESVKKNATIAERYEKRVGRNGEPYFVLKAGNHEVIGQSELYSSESARDNGIASVTRNAPAAEIVDETVNANAPATA